MEKSLEVLKIVRHAGQPIVMIGTTLNPTKTLHLLIVIYSGEKGESIVKAKEDQNSQNAQ